MQVVYRVLMVVELGVMIIVVVPGAQLEDVGQSGEDEEQELEDHLLGRGNSDDNRQQPHHLDLNDLDHQHDREESQQQLVLEHFLCEN